MKEKGVPLSPKVVRFLTGRRKSFKKKASLNFRGIRIGIPRHDEDWPLCFGVPPLSRSMGRTRGDYPENLRLLGGIWRLTQHNRRAEPSPTITVRRRVGVTSWKRTCKAYRFSHITYPGHPFHPEKVSSKPNYFLFYLFTSSLE